jgi:hypothetical protein
MLSMFRVRAGWGRLRSLLKVEPSRSRRLYLSYFGIGFCIITAGIASTQEPALRRLPGLARALAFLLQAPAPGLRLGGTSS